MSDMRRVAAASLVLALVVAGAAPAGRYDPQRKLTPADQARARAMLLRTADLGRGYTPLPGPSTWTPQKCAALDESGLTLTGERFAPSWTSSKSLVVAVARVYDSVADANRSWALELGPAGVECQSAPSGGAPVSISRLSFPSLAPKTVAFRTRFTAAVGTGVRSVGDVIALQRGRGRVTFAIVAPVKSPPSRALELRLAHLLAARQTKAMRGA
jgi:hypothetical protein